MTQLYIPEIGDVITLSKEWVFDLYNEDRNETLMKHLGDTRDIAFSWNNTQLSAVKHAIPPGAKLKIDRVYVRKGQGDYSSVSFLWVGARIPGYIEQKPVTSYMGATPVKGFRDVKYPAKPVRFWAKLADVNTIVFE